MADFLFRIPMNVSSETLVYPIYSSDRFIYNISPLPMLVSSSPVAVSNKIRAIQTRKTRLSLHSYYDFTDIRPLNIASTNGGTNSAMAFSNLTPEKALERSKDIRLGRLPARHNAQPSVPSPVPATNQQSLYWRTYNSSMGFVKQSQTNISTVPPTTPGRPSASKTPDVQQRFNRTHTTTRQPLTERQNSIVVAEPRHKSQPKNKSSVPKAYQRVVSKSKSLFPTSQTQPTQKSVNYDSKQSNQINNILKTIPLCKSEEDDENIPVMDDEFQEYFEKAMVKCADWLIRYVFDKKYDENDE